MQSSVTLRSQIPNFLSSSVPTNTPVSLWAEQISARKVQSSSVAPLIVPHCPSEAKAMGMAVDTTQQQPNDPVTALTSYLNQHYKPTARDQKEKLTPARGATHRRMIRYEPAIEPSHHDLKRMIMLQTNQE